MKPKEVEGNILKKYEIDGIYSYQSTHLQNIEVDTNKIKKAHRTHYLKWKLSGDISIRYFITFEDDVAKEKCFLLRVIIQKCIFNSQTLKQRE